MKRAGIITFQWYDNFGTLFQAFALQEAIRACGVDVCILPLTVKKDTGIRRFVSKTVKGCFYKFNKFMEMRGLHYERGFDDFRKKYYRRGGYKDIPFFDLLQETITDDVLVFGSDNIWSVGSLPIDYPGFRIFFGDGINHSNKVTYGASTAGYLDQHPLYPQIVDRIRKGGFRKISCREKYTVELLDKQGISTCWVPDPVLLHTKDFWRKYSEDSVRGGFVLNYDIGHKGKVALKDVASRLGRDMHLPVITPYPKHWLRDRKIAAYPTPQQWLGLFDGASMVVTNSFHGVAFSLLFRKDFIYVPIAGKDAAINMRAVELLKRLDLENRIVGSDDTMDDLKGITAKEWDQIMAEIFNIAAQGMEYLKSIM